ncbi:hypothetical protein FRC06_005347 [Ceratobasidium sp. 370]|nr:hypothetical protein FRC06_005347 [Ceratobasidium sp. 370]
MGVLSDEDDDLDFEDDVPLPPRPSRSHVTTSNVQQRGGPVSDIIAFTNACCEEFGLSDVLKNDTLKCAQLPLQHLLMRTYTRVLSLGQQVKHSNVSSFLNSTEFREHITRRPQCSILDPNILFYVEGTTARFVKHMIANPGVYQIPADVQENFMHSKEFLSAIGDVFSNYQSEIRRKRMYLDQYNTIVWAPKDRKKKSFWDWLDDELVLFYKLPEVAQVDKLQKNLRKDLQQYPIPSSGMSMFPPVVHVPEWQADVSLTTLEMLANFYANQTELAGAQNGDGFGGAGDGGGDSGGKEIEGGGNGGGGNGEESESDGGGGGGSGSDRTGQPSNQPYSTDVDGDARSK